MTPDNLAKRIVDYFKPIGVCLEPCKGTGNIYKYLPQPAEWCEISEGKDFFQYNKKVDWIVTNPPFKKVRDWYLHAVDLADNCVFFVMMYHIMDKKALLELRQKGFGYKEIIFCPTPRNAGFPGFQLGIVHIQKGWTEDTKITIWEKL